MMYGNYGSMMGWIGTWGIGVFLTWLIWSIVGVMLIIWLWQKISKK